MVVLEGVPTFSCRFRAKMYLWVVLEDGSRFFELFYRTNFCGCLGE